LSSTVSICELLINVVIVSKPKALSGLGQKGMQSDVPLDTRGTDIVTVGE